MRNIYHSAFKQRGAMFGLDARIALAIFGGLSVITGVALFNVTKDTQVSALRSEINNIVTGYTSMNIDTAVNNADFNALLAKPSTGMNTWNGPYLTRSDTRSSLFGGEYAMQKGDLSSGTAPPAACTVPLDCFIWLTLTEVPLPVLKDLDMNIDSVANSTAGLFRYSTPVANEATFYYAFLPDK